MPTTSDSAKCRPTWDCQNSRVFWFAQIEAAIKSGNFDVAADAARHLRRLGVEVRYPRREVAHA